MIFGLTGSRNFTDHVAFERMLSRCLQLYPDMVLSFGDAKSGLDAIAYEWSKRNLTRQQWVRHICHWPPEGASKQEVWMAAHERNGRVVKGIDRLLAFYGPEGITSGTRDCVDQAKKLGIEVFVYNQFIGMWNHA